MAAALARTDDRLRRGAIVRRLGLRLSLRARGSGAARPASRGGSDPRLVRDGVRRAVASWPPLCSACWHRPPVIAWCRERSSARRVSSLLLLVRCGRLRHTGGHARIRQVAGARRRRCPVWRWRTGRREARAGRAARCPVASPSGTRALAAEHRTELVGGAWRRARRRWGAVSGYGRVLRLLNIPGGDGHAGGAFSRDHRG